MLHISRVPCIQQTYFSLNEKIAILKLAHITLVLRGAYSLFLCLGRLRDRTAFDLSTIFLIPHKFLIRGFVIIFKRKLNVPQMVPSCRSNQAWAFGSTEPNRSVLWFFRKFGSQETWYRSVLQKTWYRPSLVSVSLVRFSVPTELTDQLLNRLHQKNSAAFLLFSRHK